MKVSAKKHLGQHFLTDIQIAENIATALTWENYSQVLEIGPGMGVLTQFLWNQDLPISVVEIDTESVTYLKQNFSTKEKKLLIFEEDFLKMKLDQLYDTPFAILGNFPYNISSQILFKTIEYRSHIPELVGMFQKEVAERVAAEKGSKIYGILSVLVQAYYKTEYLFTVSEHVFDPPPRVKSGVIRLKKYRETLPVDDQLFAKVVKLGFNQRRKKLGNALKSLPIPEGLKQDPILSLRAEQLSVEDFVELTKKVENG